MAVSDYDKQHLSASQQATIEAVTKAAQSGSMSWADAHTAAEAVRAQAGYSGGQHGNEYISTGTSGGGSGGGGSAYSGTNYHQDAINAAQKYASSGDYSDWQAVLDALTERGQKVNVIGTDYGNSNAEILESLMGYQMAGDNLQFQNKQMQLLQQYMQPVQAYEKTWGDEAYEQLLQQAIAMNYDDWTQSEQYKSLANRYGAQGKMTMQDVLGQISSRTGGLASSYATTAANQQYNEYMSQLEEVARQMFAGERGDLIENAGLARDYGEYEYGRYLDQLNQQAQQNSYALDIINQMMGYQADKENTQYNRGQNAKAEAQDRVNAYLAANGAFGGLDADLISTSGYTQGELAALEQYYADQRAAEAAKSSKGTSTTPVTQKPTLTAAQTLAALEKGVVNDTTKAAYEYYYGQAWEGEAPTEEEEEPKQTGGTPTSSYGTSYNTAWSQARKMYDNGKSDEEIMAYLDRFSEERLTEAGLRYIMNSLNLGGYRE